jgi:hypothetical protein
MVQYMYEADYDPVKDLFSKAKPEHPVRIVSM